MSFALLPLLAASALSPPNLGSEFLHQAGRNLPVSENFIVELFVAPDGTIEDCQIAYHEGPEIGPKRFCQNAIGLRAQQPAHASDGTPVYGTITMGRFRDYSPSPGASRNRPSPVTWSADLEMSVQSLPARHRGKLSVDLDVLVQPDGSISECAGSEAELKAYADAACVQLKAIKTSVRRNKAGEAVSYLTNLKVDFVTERAPKN